jgi:hypothetical protein
MYADSDFIKSCVIPRSTATRNLLLFYGFGLRARKSRFLVVPLRFTHGNDMGWEIRGIRGIRVPPEVLFLYVSVPRW